MKLIKRIVKSLMSLGSGSKLPLPKKMALDYINSIRKNSKVAFYQPTYNPNNFELYRINEVVRKTTDMRVDTIISQFDFNFINSYLDIGSQFGYFVFKLVEAKKLIACGMEMDKVLYAYSNAIVILNDLENVSFINCKLTPERAEKLPKYDLISFLNVFHHIVHFDGFDAADKIMRTLFDKCDYFVFETGQYDEKGYYWTEDLKFMGNDSNLWVKSYLTNLGYKILHIENFGTHLSEGTRSFVCCAKA
jgi:hypothetical protein